MATPKAKIFVLPEEVLKSRRNLIIIAYVACAIMFLAPAITELKLAGVEVKIAGNRNISVLLALAILIEFTTFHYRYRVSGFSDRLTRLEEKKLELVKEAEDEQRYPHLEYDEGYSPRSWDKIQETNETIYRTVETIAKDHKTAEMYLPTCIAGFAFFWCLFAYIKSYF